MLNFTAFRRAKRLIISMCRWQQPPGIHAPALAVTLEPTLPVHQICHIFITNLITLFPRCDSFQYLKAKRFINML